MKCSRGSCDHELLMREVKILREEKERLFKQLKNANCKLGSMINSIPNICMICDAIFHEDKCPVCNPTFTVGGKPLSQCTCDQPDKNGLYCGWCMTHYDRRVTLKPKPLKPIKLIYVACALTAPTEFERNLNIQAAHHAGYKLAKAGFYPVMPTVNTEGFEAANTLEFWYESTSELLRRCDAVYVVNGSHESSGVQGEVDEAARLEKPVYHCMESLIHCERC